MGFLSKIGKPLGLAIGGAALGGMLFPETFGGLTGGLFGQSQIAGQETTRNLFGFDVGTLGTAASEGGGGIFSNPTVLSSAILAGTSLLSGIYGSTDEEDVLALKQAELAEQQRQFDAKLALEREQLAQALEIAKIQASGAGSGAGAAAAAQLKIAKANLIKSAADSKAKALELPLLARKSQTEASQLTGKTSADQFNALANILQQPALRAAG